jgi:hypothetical protein
VIEKVIMKRKLYSYVVTFDAGFAPNPFWGYCTLACCKPGIRRMAQKGDWVVGLTRKKVGNKVVFAMRLTVKPLTFEQYFSDKRFKTKRPNLRSSDPRRWCGDNIYRPRGKGRFDQIPSFHSNPKDCSEDKEEKDKDLRGEAVLISRDFYYFGSHPRRLPPNLRPLVVGRGYRCRFSDKTIKSFETFIRKRPGGIHANPSDYPAEPPCEFAGRGAPKKRRNGCRDSAYRKPRLDCR